MMRYVLKRLLIAVPTFIAITLITFLLVHIAPGDPVAASLGESVTTDRAAQARIRDHFELDKPLAPSYVEWLWRTMQLDFGRSFHDGRPAREKIFDRLPATLLLTTGALLAALFVAIIVGSLAAIRPDGWFDRIVGGICFGLSATPSYVMGVVLIVIVGVRLGWLPFSGASSLDAASLSPLTRLGDTLRHALLIGICLAYPLGAYLTRFVRDNLVAVLARDYILAVQARGIRPMRLLIAHALPNALLPLLTVIGMLLPMLLGGAVILEVMFAWPGMGLLMYDATTQRDYPTIMGISALTAIVVLVGMLVVDVLYAWVDPRVRWT